MQVSNYHHHHNDHHYVNSASGNINCFKIEYRKHQSDTMDNIDSYFSSPIIEPDKLEDQKPSTSTRCKALRVFMYNLGSLLENQSQHSSNTSDEQTILKKTFPDIQKYYASLKEAVPDIQKYYVDDLQRRLHTLGEDSSYWEELCEDRSNVEAFNGFFKDVTPLLDTSAIDRIMKVRKQMEFIPTNDIPSGIPKTHWWWYENL